jgi:SNF2 family DNA or RNA helicase
LQISWVSEKVRQTFKLTLKKGIQTIVSFLICLTLKVTILLYKKMFPDEDVLILSPLNVIKHWDREFKKVMDWSECKKHERVKIFDISSEKNNLSRLSLLKEWKEARGVLLCTYELFRGCRFEQTFYELLFKPGASIIILDEGHRIKHWDAQISKAISEVQTLKRIILTGYPFQNNLVEYFTMINFVRPNYLGDLSSFKKLFVKPISAGNAFQAPLNIQQTARRRVWILYDRISPLILRRDSSFLKEIVPPKHEIVIHVQITKSQKLLYQKLIESISESEYYTVKNVLWVYNCITLICNHPQIFLKYAKFYIEKFNKSDKNEEIKDTEDTIMKKPLIEVLEKTLSSFNSLNIETGSIENSSKLTLAISIIFQSKKRNDKVVLFTKSVSTLNFIENILNHHNSSRKHSDRIKYLRFDGSTSSDKRETYIDQFNGSESFNLFLISTLAGGEGKFDFLCNLF